jgi:tetratricopeptide (TPR) repeat protein
MNLADAHIHQGEFAQALARSQELVRFGQDSADRQALCWGLARQGYAQHGLGQLAEAASSLVASIDLARSIPDYQTYVDSGGELGKCYLHQGRLEEAFAVFAECQQLSLEHKLKKSPVITRFINGLAEACLLAVEQGIEAEKDSSLKKAGQACRDALKQGKVYTPGMPEAMMLQGRYEWLRGDPRAANKWWQRSLLLAEQIGVCYDLGRTHFEIGQRLGESSHLEKAGAIFAQIGAELYIERMSSIGRSEIPGLAG